MNLERDAGFLRNLALFSGCDDEQLRLIAFNAEHRHYRDGQHLFRQGDAARSAFVILAGTVTLARQEAAAARGEDRYGPGTVLGETAVLAAGIRPASARADGPVECLEVSRAMFLRLMEEYPDVARALHARLSARTAALLDELGAMRPRFDDEG